MSLTLLLGGARSGKSDLAEAMAGAESARLGAGVTYLAGAEPNPGDPDWLARIAEHRRRRPAGWLTVDSPLDLAALLGGPSLTGRIVLLDSLGTWLARRADFHWDDALVDALARRSAPTLVVSEEVGMGVHPSSPGGRRFRDALGRLNRAVADGADRVLLVVAGRALPLERP